MSKIALLLQTIDHQSNIKEEYSDYLRENAESIAVIVYLYKSMNRFNITEDHFRRQLQLFGLPIGMYLIIIEIYYFIVIDSVLY